MDEVFRALADASRRELLDRLRADNGQTLNELCARLDMTRQAVSKHLGILEEANLVATVKRGREKLHYLNPVPIHQIGERWIGKFESHRLQALSELKKGLGEMMSKPSFVYVTYIRTTPEKLWAALTDPQIIRKYWFGITAESDFKPGSPWALKFEDGRVADTGEILEAVPPRRLVIRWRNEFKPELKAAGYSRCTMEIEVADYYPDRGGKAVKLTIQHEIDGEGGGKFIEAVSGGCRSPADLKSLLETGDIAFDVKASCVRFLREGVPLAARGASRFFRRRWPGRARRRRPCSASAAAPA
jgi:uncharacterized protein YndB with AHSA1/START domain/DNA-binding transcriptional ArsR family regulator